MRFKLDENLGSSAAKLLKDAGHDVETVQTEKLSGAPDDKIFDICTRENRCLITLDLDFSNILRFPPYDTPGVIILRPHKFSDLSQIHRLLKRLLRACTSADPAKSIWIIETNTIRIHSKDFE